MGRDKVHILQIPKRQPPRETALFARVPSDVLFLVALAIAFVLAHYSDKPPLVEQPITLERTEGPLVAQSNGPSVNILDTGLRSFER